MKKRPHILSIAGFDPSGGAGILADVKTFEANRCVGMAVQTANTIQTEDAFLSVNWIEERKVINQLNVLLEGYTFTAFKIGLVHSLSFLNEIIPLLRKNNEKAKIIWDPILSASAGFDFGHELSALNSVIEKVDWMTPNWNEAVRLDMVEKESDKIKNDFNGTNIYLKGGHNEKNIGRDYWLKNGNTRILNPKKGRYAEKHGSGCVFSSALAANLANGYPEQKAVLRTKRYVEQFLKSSETLLGHHKL